MDCVEGYFCFFFFLQLGRRFLVSLLVFPRTRTHARTKKRKKNPEKSVIVNLFLDQAVGVAHDGPAYGVDPLLLFLPAPRDEIFGLGAGAQLKPVRLVDDILRPLDAETLPHVNHPSSLGRGRHLIAQKPKQSPLFEYEPPFTPRLYDVPLFHEPPAALRPVPKLNPTRHVSLRGRQPDGAQEVVHLFLHAHARTHSLTHSLLSRVLLLLGALEGVFCLCLREHFGPLVVRDDVDDFLPRLVFVLGVGEVHATLDERVDGVIHPDPAVSSAVPLGPALPGHDVARNHVFAAVLFDAQPSSRGVSADAAAASLLFGREAHKDGGGCERREEV